MNKDEKKDSSETESGYSAISSFLGMFITFDLGATRPKHIKYRVQSLGE